MKHRSSSPPISDNDRLCRIRSPLRTDVILRRHRHHEPSICSSLCGQHPGSVDLGRLLRGQRHPHSILRLPFSFPLCHCRCHTCTPSFPTSNRLKQPPRLKLRRRQNLLPPLFFLQRSAWLCSTPYCSNSSRPLFPQPLRRPR